MINFTMNYIPIYTYVDRYSVVTSYQSDFYANLSAADYRVSFIICHCFKIDKIHNILLPNKHYTYNNFNHTLVSLHIATLSCSTNSKLF